MTALNYIIEDLRIRAEKAEAALQSLTSGGSEFHGDPDRCVGFVRERRDEAHRLALDLRSQRDSERARADRYLAAITEYVQATAAEEQAEEAYALFGRRMLDRTLPPVTEADVDAAFIAVANARNRAYAATGAIRAIAGEVKHD